MDKILELFDPIIKVFNEQFNAIWQMLEKYLSPTINKVAGDLSDKFWFIIPRLFFSICDSLVFVIPVYSTYLGVIEKFM